MEIIEGKIQQIAKEMQEANASEWTITKIIKALSEMKTTSEKKLKEKTLELLKEFDPKAAVIYEQFSKMNVYTSNEKILPFNRGNIITSLLKETTISRSAAEKITTEVENQIKDAKINFLTPSLIRELVNTKLISYGLEEIRNNYARVGEPIFDVKQKLLEDAYFGETVREYTILSQLPKMARESHFNSIIHIEDIEGYSHRPYAYSIIAEKKETFEKTMCTAIKEVIQNRKYFCLQPSIYGITFACAGFAKNDAQAKKIAELTKNAAEITSEELILSLELYTPKIFEKNGEEKLKAAKIANQLLAKNTVACVDSKYALKLIQPEGKNFTILNNCEADYFPLTKKLFCESQGIDLYVNINLEKIAMENNENFFDALGQIAQQIHELKEKKQKLLQEKKYLEKFSPEKFKTAIGLTSLPMLAQNFESKSTDFANKTYKELSKLFDDYLLFGLSSEKARERFGDSIKKHVYSQETLGFDECLKEKKCCFSGKASTIKEVNELLDKKIKQIDYISN